MDAGGNTHVIPDRLVSHEVLRSTSDEKDLILNRFKARPPPSRSWSDG